MELDGRSIETAWFGPGPDQATTLVLLHEGLGCVALWRDFPQRLVAATGCGVFAYSRFGYGASAPVPLPRPADLHGGRGGPAGAGVGLPPGSGAPCWWGHSDGASIATLYAGGRQDFRVAGLVLVAPHFFVEEITLASIRAAREAYRTGDLRARLARHHADPDNAFHGWNDAWLNPAFRTWRCDDAIPFIRVPVLAIQGEEDQYGTAAQLELARDEAYCPVETLMVAGARHAPQFDQPVSVVDAVAGFVARLEHMQDNS